MCSVSNIPERRKTPPLRGSLVKWEYTNTVSKITLSMCLADAGIVRVTYFPGAVPEDEPSYAVSPGYSAPGAEIREYDEDGVHVVETSLLRIRIRTEEQKVDFYDVATDEPLLTDEGGFGRESKDWTGDARVWIRKNLQETEHFFGLGDKPCALNLRGKYFSMWGADHYDFHEESDPLYKSIPFFLSLRERKAYGLLFDNTCRSYFDFGATDEKVLSFGSFGGLMNYYFIYGRTPLDIIPSGFYFMDSYPLLAYSVHCEIDPKLSTFYRCLNGARDFDHSTDTEGNHILDLHTGDSGRVIPDFWYNSARQTPMILMYIYNSKTPYAWMPPSARKPGLYANPNPKLMTDDTRASMKAPGTNWSGLRSGRKSEISKALKARQAEGWSDKKLMDYLYQYCYYRYMENGADYTPASFILLMHELLEKAGIPHRTGITTKETREALDQLINYSNTTWFIYLESNGKCYTPPACYAVPGEVPASLQGEEAILEDNTCLTLPSTTPQDNRDIATINASISGTTLHISRREEMSGALKEHFQPYLIMDEDLYNSVRRQLGITATIYDETKEKFHADLRESYRREREQEKERYRNEIIGYHGSEEGLETLLGYQLFSIGNRADSAALAYQVDYVLDGYVKKAGTNFVLSVGRLIGSQPELKGEQRLRKEDIYWEMPRCYQWDITVNLPEGYRISPEGLERLNVKVENDCGAFIVQATTEDGTLRIKAEKRINHKTEPVANWEKLLEITDAANSYEALSIVFQATINPPTSPTTGY